MKLEKILKYGGATLALITSAYIVYEVYKVYKVYMEKRDNSYDGENLFI